jgi:hypothetical protein
MVHSGARGSAVAELTQIRNQQVTCSSHVAGSNRLNHFERSTAGTISAWLPRGYLGHAVSCVLNQFERVTFFSIARPRTRVECVIAVPDRRQEASSVLPALAFPSAVSPSAVASTSRAIATFEVWSTMGRRCA